MSTVDNVRKVRRRYIKRLKNSDYGVDKFLCLLNDALKSRIDSQMVDYVKFKCDGASLMKCKINGVLDAPFIDLYICQLYYRHLCECRMTATRPIPKTFFQPYCNFIPTAWQTDVDFDDIFNIVEDYQNFLKPLCKHVIVAEWAEERADKRRDIPVKRCGNEAHKLWGSVPRPAFYEVYTQLFNGKETEGWSLSP